MRQEIFSRRCKILLNVRGHQFETFYKIWLTELRAGGGTPNYWQTQASYVMIFLQELQCSGIQSNILHVEIPPVLSLQNNIP